MDLILFDENFKEICPIYPTGDFEIGDSDARNDFELTGKELKVGYGVYIPGTEIAGIIEKAEYHPENGDTFSGWTLRGLLTQDIIFPPSGSNYRTVSGEAHAVIRSLINESELLKSIFSVSETTSGITFKSHQFNLYETYLDGIMDLCEENGAKLVLKAIKGNDKKVHFVMSVESVSTISGNYDEDSRVKLVFTENGMGINHLVCMGKGELQNRQRVDLYIDDSGKITKIQSKRNFLSRTALYDYGNAESLQDLEDNGRKRLKEISSSKRLEIIEDGIVGDIGDIVNGRYRKQNLTISTRIRQAVYKFSGYEKYKVEIDVKEI